VQGEGDEAARGAEVKLSLDPVLSGKILDLLAVRGLADLEKAVGPANPGFQGLSRLMALAQAAGIADCISIDCSVVRGLSYYTGTVWELFDASGDMPRAIAGGGRYDQLLNTFGGQTQPMVGFGFGDVVILDILNKRGLVPPLSRNVDDVIFPMAEDGDAAALALATKLRGDGRRVWTDLSHRRFKHVVGNAETLGAQKLWILGQDELARGVAKVRTMADRTEAEVPL
jgi:histidyl-tRNA synthetase